MCSTYVCKPNEEGAVEVQIHHPGGTIKISLKCEMQPVSSPASAKQAGTVFKAANSDLFPKYSGPVIRNLKGKPEAAFMKWGYIPHWAKNPLHNAQAEKLRTSPVWRDSFQTRRCLAPATAFYEWRSVPGSKRKQKMSIRPLDQEVFCFAALWQSFRDKEGQNVECYTIITTTPNEFMRPIHHRMPVMLDPEAQARWLDVENTSATGLEEFVGPYSGGMEATPVTT